MEKLMLRKNILKFKKMNHKGVLGLDTATKFVLAIFVMAILAFAVLIAMGALLDANVTTTAVQGNATEGVLNNVSSGIQTLFNSAVTWFSLLAIVILILIIAVVILAVRGFGGGGRL